MKETVGCHRNMHHLIEEGISYKALKRKLRIHCG